MNGFRDWLTSAFGADGGRAVQMVLALLLVVGLLLVLAWMFRRLFGGGFSSHKGGRLSVLDSAPVDGRRRLILLRRDDVEHLVMVGGPNDVLVESRILRGAPVIAQGGMPPRTAAAPTMRVPNADEADARTAIDDRAEGPGSRNAARGGPIAAMGAAVAGAGAFIKSKTAKGGAGEGSPEPRRTVDQAFDAPLGRAPAAGPREPSVRDAASREPAPRVPEPVELPLQSPPSVTPPTVPADASGRRAPVPPMPPQAMMGRSAKPVAPPPPPPPVPAVEIAAAPAAKVAPLVAAAAAVAAVEPSLEDALFEPAPSVVVPPAPIDSRVDAVVPPLPAVKSGPKSLDDIDLLSELNLGLEEFARLEPKPIAPIPASPTPMVMPPVPSAPTVSATPGSAEVKSVEAPAPTPVVKAPKIPKVEPPPVKVPVSTAAPEAPQPIDRLEFLFEEAMLTGVSSEPVAAVPEVKLDAVAVPANEAAPIAVEAVVEAPPVVAPASPTVSPKQAVDELEEEMARLLAEISGPQKR